MKERPILFSAPMVRALLEGRKTQTRRIVKKWHFNTGSEGLNVAFSGLALDEVAPGFWKLSSRGEGGAWNERCAAISPYGIPGDRLWVREAFTFINADRDRNEICIGYDADGNALPSRPSIFVTPEQFSDFMGDEREKVDQFKRRKYPPMFMNRFFSRLTLEITEVRVQRLRNISFDDALAEGVTYWTNGHASPGSAFMELWDSINRPSAHYANPWVWAVSFKVMTA